jgi:hypothetical protein
VWDRRPGAAPRQRREGGAARSALLAIALGPTLASQDNAEAGLRHRRRVRNRHDHDHRKGKRQGRGRNNRPPGAGAAPVDCRNRPDGTPCNFIGDLYQMRCCNGVCPEYRSCVPRDEIVPVSCTRADECSGYAGACCSGLITCDTKFESACLCLPAFSGEPCVTDHDCSGQCVCGLCR